jgi:hypothetical protein
MIGRVIMIRWHCIFKRGAANVVIVIVVQVTAATEVGRSFMFMSSSILSQVSVKIGPK